MTAQAEGYSQARHVQRVQAAAREAGVKGAAYAVLSYLCSVSDFREPITRASKERIEERLGYCDKTIKAALAVLRRGGFIEAVAYATGGRGRCPVYVLRSGKGGENYPPLNGSEDAKGGKFFPEKGGKNFPKRGEKTSPPSVYSSSDLSRGEGAASRGGRTTRPLDAGASPGPRTGPRYEPAEIRRLGEETARYGYAEARRRQDERLGPAGQG